MDIKEIIALMEAVSENGLTTLELEHGDTRIKMKREPEKTGTESMAVRQIVRDYENVDSMVYTESGNRITCPLVGTFYSAPAPDAEDFVKVGDHVKKGQVVGIVEAMKLMNEIESEYDGIVEAVLVENESMVEYGQPLFIIR
ncbi:MAG: acetyl-CoA carboxylase biotin carboxyl carrier protein [Lachnospiraceae bacterium]|nr:acetyl-CoA carboxylase biotin carboxyl carrier protein [Lachnospiraceae bacterium]